MAEQQPGSLWESADGVESVLSTEAKWDGKINSRGSLRVEGSAHGELEIAGTLTIAAQAHVDGTVRARTMVLGGELQGQVHCEQRLELQSGSTIGGDIETGTLTVEEGAFIEANSFKMLKPGPVARR